MRYSILLVLCAALGGCDPATASPEGTPPCQDAGVSQNAPPQKTFQNVEFPPQPYFDAVRICATLGGSMAVWENADELLEYRAVCAQNVAGPAPEHPEQTLCWSAWDTQSAIDAYAANQPRYIVCQFWE